MHVACYEPKLTPEYKIIFVLLVIRLNSLITLPSCTHVILVCFEMTYRVFHFSCDFKYDFTGFFCVACTLVHLIGFAVYKKDVF